MPNRVPGFVIGSYAKRGYIDHQTLSFDAYLKSCACVWGSTDAGVMVLPMQVP